jgi:hypothetical protein
MASSGGNDTSSLSSLSSDYQQDEDQPWHIPRLRTWEINENSTRFDNVVAAPSDDSLITMWFGWATIVGFVGFFALMIFIPITAQKKIRNNPFNRYLIYLMVPDIIFSISCGLTCFFNGLAGHYVSEWSCKAQSFYFVFDVAANSWLNAAVCKQLFQMLSSAERFQRYSPPSLHRVNLEALLIYAWAAFVASWGLWDQPWWPHKTFLVIGAACIPVDFSNGSTVFYYLIFFPSLIGIPFVYLLYAGYQIRKRNLIPPTGKRRVLSIYFLRLVAVFVIMWLPALLFMTVLNRWIGHWLMWFGGTWSHMQGGVSAAVSLFKPDIAKTVYRFWTCQWGGDDQTGSAGGPSQDLELSTTSLRRGQPSLLFSSFSRRFSTSTTPLESIQMKKQVRTSGLSAGNELSGEEGIRLNRQETGAKVSLGDESSESKRMTFVVQPEKSRESAVGHYDDDSNAKLSNMDSFDNEMRAPDASADTAVSPPPAPEFQQEGDGKARPTSFSEFISSSNPLRVTWTGSIEDHVS